MKGEARLRGVEHVLQLAHAALAVRQQAHDLEPGLVREGVEYACRLRDLGKRRRCHVRNISISVDMSKRRVRAGYNPNHAPTHWISRASSPDSCDACLGVCPKHPRGRMKPS